ncbi:MAG: AraC family transcriptional regulator [Bacteroidota bacterium]|nr:AraC family transcriptional regulator [Bacteroidota bacterium]MDP4216628.1 AraC family transcriptional regulator [Bacteroidota bacterium]MDP4246954.1 AraC family transcriptional regulator [Bacteroidota bacterium]MDP4255300.1 AraC family transcriptional regulator [Bacteroidota bacterium]MDP4260536.1 AraC family transcriptional regulator [Bacteroidota bacterium]
MGDSSEMAPGSIVYTILSQKEREKDVFLNETILLMQVSGKLTLETSGKKVTTREGDLVLLRKHQLLKITKTPLDGKNYEIIIVVFGDDLLRKYALENQLDVEGTYAGKTYFLFTGNEFLKGYFQSLLPYIGKPQSAKRSKLGEGKVKEAIGLLLESMPGLGRFLFALSDAHKIDLEKIMLSNFQFNVPLEKFAQLAGRSLAGFKRDFQKTFHTSPRQWLQDKRLEEAYHQIKKRGRKPSAIYLGLGFESLSHFSRSFKQKYGMAPSEIVSILPKTCL